MPSRPDPNSGIGHASRVLVQINVCHIMTCTWAQEEYLADLRIVVETPVSVLGLFDLVAALRRSQQTSGL
jgi:hypothetical protein